VSFTEKERNEIIAALTAKVPNPPPCAICGRQQWMVQKKYIVLLLQEDINNLTLEGQSLPCAAIICSNCGNTHLLNLFMLGLKHLVESKEKKESQ